MLTSVIHDCFSLANKMPYQDYFVTLSHREIRGLNGLRRHFFHQTRMVPTVMDAGNSRRGLNSSKLIMDKNSLVVCERTVDPYCVGVGFVLVQCAGKSDRLFDLSHSFRTVHLSSGENHSCVKFVAEDFNRPKFVACLKMVKH